MSTAPRRAAMAAVVLAGWAMGASLAAGAAFTASPTEPVAPVQPVIIPAEPAAPVAAAPERDAPVTPLSAPVVEGDFLALQRRYIELFQDAQTAVVKINVAHSNGAGDGRATVYACTGFFFSHDGYILTTNAHLLAGADRVWIEHEGIPYSAEVVGLDPVSNVAVLRALKLPKDFGVLTLQANADLPPVGSLLLAVTCKMGEDPAPSTGMVQGYNIAYGDQPLATQHLRTSIPHDGGEGGSPVFDLNGQLVGIIVASLPETRSSLVLPARAALRVREDLLNHGRVLYGRFGFQVEAHVTEENGPQVLIKSMDYGGPAALAGLHNHDLLVSIGGTPIRSEEDLRQVAFFTSPRQYVVVRVHRDDRDLDLPLWVGEMEPPAPPPPASPAAQPANGASPPAPAAVAPAAALPLSLSTAVPATGNVPPLAPVVAPVQPAPTVAAPLSPASVTTTPTAPSP